VTPMDCAICKDLERELESRYQEFKDACCSASYGISTKPAAYRNVDMEFARSALQDHRSICASAVRKPTLQASRPASPNRRPAAA
jgi:hypothetical protein